MIKKIMCLFLIGAIFSLTGLMTDSAYAKRLTPEEKQAKNDNRSFVLMEKKIKELKRYMDMKSYTSAKRTIAAVNKYYEKLSDSFKNNPEAVRAKEELDSLESEYNRIVEGETAARNKSENLRKLSWEFDSALKPYRDIIYFLYMGKEKKYSTNFSYKIDEYRKGYENLGKLENLLKTKFAEMVSDAPNHNVRDVGTVKEIVELVTNREKYRNSCVDVICATLLDNRIAELDNTYERLKNYQVIYDSWIDNLYGSEKNADLPIIGRCQKIIDWTGKSLPSDKVKRVRDFKPRTRKLIEQLADKNEWNSSKYTYENRDMKKIADKYAEKKGMKLEEIAMTSDSEWKIVKNAFGVPLRKVGYGYALFKKSGEPFLRGYACSFTREYNGSRYEDISSISFSSEIKPHDD